MSTEIDRPGDRLLRLVDVKGRVGFGKTAIYEMIAQGRFPKPYKPTPGAARWSEHEIDHWISGVTSSTLSDAPRYKETSIRPIRPEPLARRQ